MYDGDKKNVKKMLEKSFALSGFEGNFPEQNRLQKRLYGTESMLEFLP